MDDEVYSFALKNTLNEVRNVCPELTSAFMFREDGEIIGGDENTHEKTMVNTVNAFDSILEKTEAIGGVESLTLKGSNGRINVSHIDNFYLVTVASKKADMNYVDTVTRVLVPTVLKLLEKICSTPLKENSSSTETKPQPEFSLTEKLQEPRETIEPRKEPESSISEPPVNQLIVENLGGLLVTSDTVRIDNKILLQWEELYDGRKIEEVEIETFDGKTTQCKVKPIKDSKYEGKGIMQMPEKIQLALEIKKGELVRAKPIVD